MPPVLTVTPPHPVPGPAGCGGAQGRLAHKLLHDLFANYSSALRPAEDTDRALNVTLQVTLSQIIDMVSTGTGTPLSPSPAPLCPQHVPWHRAPGLCSASGSCSSPGMMLSPTKQLRPHRASPAAPKSDQIS